MSIYKLILIGLYIGTRSLNIFYGGRNIMKNNKNDDEIFIVRAPENQEEDIPPNNDLSKKRVQAIEYLEFIKYLDIIKLQPILTLFLFWSLLALLILSQFVITITSIIASSKGLMGIILIVVILLIMKSLTPKKIKALNETLQNLAELIKGWFI